MSGAGAERKRLGQADAGGQPWREWGPYVAERAWGTVREDYSEWGTAWDYFPHDHARSRVYRWNEDGLAGICDDQQRFVFALAFWNGRDPILKERIFGLGGPEGNHGEDPKEYWWYLDSTPTHSWMTWRYHYPQAEFPYAGLAEANRERGRDQPEYELIDTGVFDENRYWAITADYAKAGPTDLCVRITVANRGPDEETLHVLPTMWFRNTWMWGLPGRGEPPVITADGTRLVADHQRLGRLVLTGAGDPTPLLCDNESNAQRLWNLPNRTPYPKDGINDHVVHGADTVNPEGVGTKGALHYTVTVPAGESVELRLRLTLHGPVDEGPACDLTGGFDEVMAARLAEADDFFAALTPDGAGKDEALVLRQAVAGLMWSKQFYHYDVARWLKGDPYAEAPPESHQHGRNARWSHMTNCEVISMPDTWEYPWYAAWDLAFHCVAIAHVDPGYAKSQLLLLLQEWYMHPNGQLPAYEWAFDDVNPPVHAWAALKVFEIDGAGDFGFLKRVLHKLLMNFTWWVNRKDSTGNNIFEGGFLGLDNIGPFDRSSHLPVDGTLEQSDGTAWMASYALNLLEISLVLAHKDPAYADLAPKFFEHFAYIAAASRQAGLWDEDDSFYYDVLRETGGATVPLRVRSVVGLLPLAATATISTIALARLPELTSRLRWFLSNKPEYADVVGGRRINNGQQHRLLSMVGQDRLLRILSRMFDEKEFLSEYGLRALSKAHKDEPYTVSLGGTEFGVGYEPGESTTGVFGGNSNWRGPVWFPVNFLLIEALRRYYRFYGDDLLVEYPTGSGHKLTLGAIADDLSQRLVKLFLDDPDGRRPVFGDVPKFQQDPDWHDLVPFYEYFHGDTGAGLGASHQTGWTALVANLILRTRR
ncbi:MGH1-like glycoside hydrolase domain-containing protein [Rugosimonospora africana]|uniref:Glucosidase n=1 Tax=Rugosimonospora africana TaxID=556532 RepID=A0A8J3QMV8_9ACTN|nr:glucosidase [Rugosimonospora africana]GIH12872.1 glucosidase [Rugosimonospora africana]